MESGKLLLKSTRNIFHQLEQVQITIKELKGIRVGSISILNFHHLYPVIKISVLGLRTGGIWKRMLENELDIGIVFLPMKDQGNELGTIPLYGGNVLCGTQRTPIRGSKRINFGGHKDNTFHFASGKLLCKATYQQIL